VDDHWAHVESGRASVEVADGNVYLAMSVRNAGTGIAVLQVWRSGRRTGSRFVLTPSKESQWLCGMARHWDLDRPAR
jgi:hypothetical protein